MKKNVTLLLIILLIPVWSFTSLRAQNEIGCVKCHTDEEKIRSLYVPPKIEVEAEEGEG